LRDPGPDLLAPFLKAVRELEREGVRAITGSCGFLALYQRELADAVDVPVFMSSLVQLPLVWSLLKREQTVGVLTASEASLTPAHLEAVGAVDVPVRIEGMDGSQEFDSVIIEAERTRIDFDKLEAEIVAAAGRLVDRNPDVGALVLECTDMSPFADAVQRRVQRPVFDLVTLTEMVYAAVTRARHPLFAPAARWS
jgi:Asp/Glu/hydantoin racemase